MAYEIPGFAITMRAEAELPDRYLLVARNTNGNIQLAAAGGAVWGAIDQSCRAGEVTRVITQGIAMVKSGGAIDVGAPVVAGDNGTVVAGDAAAAIGYAMEAVLAAGDIAPVLLRGLPNGVPVLAPADGSSDDLVDGGGIIEGDDPGEGDDPSGELT